MLSICFDDFPRTAWTEGGRVLRDHAVRATYYFSGGLAGTVFDGQRMYEASDLEAIYAEGHELACHTFDHRSCLRRNQKDLMRTLEDNARFVREQVGDVRLVSFAYPYGDATVGAKRLAVGRFSSSRGVDAGLNRGRLDLGQLKAVGLEASKRGITSVEQFVTQAAQQGAWLLVYTHDVQSSPSGFGCRPEELDRLLSSARNAGLEILPVKAALAARVFTQP
jgi:peptidoglycan/xylan/chitin deacetylase (PgdA/CDA1 family)